MPTGMYIRKNKIKHDKQFKKGQVPWNKGKKGLQISTKPMLGKKHSKETKIKMSESHKGHSRSGMKIREDAKSRIKGRKLPEEVKEKISRAHMGDKHWNWKGDKLKRYIHTTGTRQYKKWRSDVFQRDNWACQTCGFRGYIEAHHIKSWAKYPKYRFIVENGVTLCKECHKIANRNI